MELERDHLAIAGGQVRQRRADGGAAQRDLGAVVDADGGDVLGIDELTSALAAVTSPVESRSP